MLNGSTVRTDSDAEPDFIPGSGGECSPARKPHQCEPDTVCRSQLHRCCSAAVHSAEPNLVVSDMLRSDAVSMGTLWSSLAKTA